MTRQESETMDGAPCHRLPHCLVLLLQYNATAATCNLHLINTFESHQTPEFPLGVFLPLTAASFYFAKMVTPDLEVSMAKGGHYNDNSSIQYAASVNALALLPADLKGLIPQRQKVTCIDYGSSEGRNSSVLHIQVTNYFSLIFLSQSLTNVLDHQKLRKVQ